MRLSWRDIPNLLSLSRVLCAFVFLWTFSAETPQQMLPSLSVLAYALLSDFFDGYLARKLAVSSKTGYFLDGLGDRSISVAILLVVILAYPSQIFLCWALIFREILIYALRALDDHQHESLVQLRWLSLAQAALIRVFFLAFLLASAAAVPEKSVWIILVALPGWLAVGFGYAGILAHIQRLVRLSDGQM
ncbi:CDP-alcohol phosphatidyltransferase family protein [uncultured Cohaesibacter sp.]|uniref:CDP-alcohol phosphatidyltransferase family protein n=1 Tax=uncultured Cohaesibacter sp. TaxID=1002546 RepID=UPI002AAB032E|nr:CDP-alcohol phosphatidyltransferase family protein [uncultured Cohaesibacter sp.]